MGLPPCLFGRLAEGTWARAEVGRSPGKNSNVIGDNIPPDGSRGDSSSGSADQGVAALNTWCTRIYTGNGNAVTHTGIQGQACVSLDLYNTYNSFASPFGSFGQRSVKVRNRKKGLLLPLTSRY